MVGQNRLRRLWQGRSHLLRALRVDVLERMLCFLLVVPHQICESLYLTSLRVFGFFYRVNVADIVLPRAGRRTPLLLLLYALRTGGRCV